MDAGLARPHGPDDREHLFGRPTRLVQGDVGVPVAVAGDHPLDPGHDPFDGSRREPGATRRLSLAKGTYSPIWLSTEQGSRPYSRNMWATSGAYICSTAICTQGTLTNCWAVAVTGGGKSKNRLCHSRRRRG